MQIKRHYTTSGDSPYASLAFGLRTSEVRDFNGEAISEAIEFEAPERDALYARRANCGAQFPAMV